MARTHEVVVVGAGLIGSAAARHLAEAGADVVLVGPTEPVEGAAAEVHASHYDAGRILRQVGWDDTWTRLTVETAAALAELEEASGRRLHDGVGCLYVTPNADDPYFAAAPARARRFAIPCRQLSAAELAARSPPYHFADGVRALFEDAPAGVIFPRELVAAQHAVARRAGATLLEATVAEVLEGPAGVRLRTTTGEELTADRALVAAGAFSNHLALLPRPLVLRVKTETTLLAQVDEAEAARLANLPALLYEEVTDDGDSVYVTPPLRYPDGRQHVKLGRNLADDRWFGDPPLPADRQAVHDWFATGDSSAQEPVLAAALRRVLPDIEVQALSTRRCVVSYTAHRHPYVGPLAERVHVAAGGNGYAAMCSDALGRVAASLLTEGVAPPGHRADAFTPITVAAAAG